MNYYPPQNLQACSTSLRRIKKQTAELDTHIQRLRADLEILRQNLYCDQLKLESLNHQRTMLQTTLSLEFKGHASTENCLVQVQRRYFEVLTGEWHFFEAEGNPIKKKSTPSEGYSKQIRVKQVHPERIRPEKTRSSLD